MVQNFLSIMNSRSCRSQLNDKLWWKETNSDSYSIKSYFDRLEGRSPLFPQKWGFLPERFGGVKF